MSEQDKAFEKWWRSEPHRLKYESDHPVYMAAYEAWQAALSGAPSAEPVAWVQKDMLYDDGFTHAFNVQPYAAENYVPLYTAPPNLSAAVAAAIEQAAQEVNLFASTAAEYSYTIRIEHLHDLIESIRALQTEDGLAALREFGMNVIHEGRAMANRGFDMSDEQLLAAIVDRVMKGE